MDESRKAHEAKILERENGGCERRNGCVTMEVGNNGISYQLASNRSLIGDSSNSVVSSSSSSSDMSEDESSSNSSSSPPKGPLFELSELMAQLPLKRGLSRYYQGKSQTFASLACVKGVEDLVKKERPRRRRKPKSCKSGFNAQFSPKATISKKTSSRISPVFYG
ncbi:hypothetical protein NMG60_11021938 [Bertholletia excelsa]